MMATSRKRPIPKKQKPAHPDLIPGLERLYDEGRDVHPDVDAGPWELHSHPIYHEVLSELLVKKVPA